MSSTPAGRLNINNVNPHVREAKYAVRGELAVKSEEYRAKLARGDTDLPFKQVISANIGNPQQLDQKPITFFRQVLSLLENPLLLQHEDVLLNQLGYKTDVIERAKWLLSKAGSVGAYSASNGVPAIRQSVADFLESKFALDARNSRGRYADAVVVNEATLDEADLLQDETASQPMRLTSTSRVVPPRVSTPSCTLSARAPTQVFWCPSPSTLCTLLHSPS